MKIWEDFKTFAFKGNVIDMAIGVVVGGAFSKTVTSLVNDIITPFFGFLTSGADFKQWKLVLSQAVVENGQEIKPEAAILYGSFLQNVVDFLIIAGSIFLAVRLVNKARHRKEEKDEKKEEIKEEAAPSPTEVELLCEIRDLLRQQKDEQNNVS